MKKTSKTKAPGRLKKRFGAQKVDNWGTFIVVLLGSIIIGLAIFTGLQLIGRAEDPAPDSLSFIEPDPKPSIDSGSPVGTIVLGRPTDTSVTANIIPDKNWEVVIKYGTEPGNYTEMSLPYKSANKQPINIELSGLKPDSQYYYKMAYRTADDQPYQEQPEYKFHTARGEGQSFTFAVQSDGHFDLNSDELYAVTANNMLSSKPDFVMDLGDKLMTVDYAKSYSETLQNYQKPRRMLSLVGNSAPLFLANGNHEGESGWLDKGKGDDITVWATKARKLLFNNPVPNAFYSGDSTPDKHTGLRASYYAWQWGDALFVVLDPFWNTKNIDASNSNDNLWKMTLGQDQYNWLNNTLRSSQAKYKFVFAHHILSSTMHGGTYWAKYGEWGGYNKDDSWGFSEHRPGWAMPITKLFSTYKVNIFFQGHDHIFAKEDLGGVTYQEVPQPNSYYGQAWLSRQFPYSGVTQASPGYIRVTVNPKDARVDYIRSYTQNSQTQTEHNADISYSYTVYPSN